MVSTTFRLFGKGDDPQLEGLYDRLGPIGDVEFLYYVLYVVLYRAHAYHEILSDLAVCLSLGQHLEHL